MTGFSPLGSLSYEAFGWTTSEDSVIRNRDVLAIAKRHGVTGAQVVLRWAVQRGTSVVVKTSNVDRMTENLESADPAKWSEQEGLSDEEMAKLESLNQNIRFNDPGVFTEGMGSFFPIYE